MSQEPLGSSPNEAPVPRNTRAIPQVVTIASPSPNTRSLVWESLSWAAAFISCKLCIVTILRERFVPEFGMDPIVLQNTTAKKITEGASSDPKVKG